MTPHEHGSLSHYPPPFYILLTVSLSYYPEYTVGVVGQSSQTLQRAPWSGEWYRELSSCRRNAFFSGLTLENRAFSLVSVAM
jgi:hypothetical protein